jgi:hypothetical protein
MGVFCMAMLSLKIESYVLLVVSKEGNINKMYSYEEIEGRSISENELVVNYTDAMELLYIFDQNSIQICRWEGWLAFDDGMLTHSQKYQGVGNLSSMPFKSALALAKSTIIQAYTEWQENHEAENVELYFCITINA